MAPKAVFVDFDIEARLPGKAYKPKSVIRDINQAWTSLTPVARLAITNEIAKAKVAVARAEEQQIVAGDASATFTADGHSPSTFRDARDKTIEEYDHYRALQTRSRDDWAALEQEYRNNNLLLTAGVVKGKIDAADTVLALIDRICDATKDHADKKFPVPDDANGVPKMKAEWLTSRRKEVVRHAVAKTAALQGTSDLDPKLRWVPWKEIGEGGYGLAWVWICFDEDDTIKNRTVRKDTDYYVQWHDIRSCSGPDVRSYTNRRHWEHTCHGFMTNTARSAHTVRVTSPWTSELVDPVTRTHRIYTEWCKGGDLLNLINKCQKLPSDQRYIPEPMIWATAEALALAGLAMQKGTEDVKAPAPTKKWDPIIHRDLKPQNICLGTRNPTDLYATYPKPLLGDFGLAFQTSPVDRNNPTNYTNVGTPSFLAPEQSHYIDRDDLTTISPWRLTEKTNVWGIGVILWTMVTLLNGPEHQPDWLGPNPEDDLTFRLQDEDGTPRFEPTCSNAWRYSQELRTLIDACTNYHPDKRPDFAALINKIQDVGDEEWDAPDDDDADDEEVDEMAGWYVTKGMRSGWAREGMKEQYGLKMRGKGGLAVVPWDLVDSYRDGLERGAIRPRQRVEGDDGEESEESEEESEEEEGGGG